MYQENIVINGGVYLIHSMFDDSSYRMAASVAHGSQISIDWDMKESVL